MRIVLLAFVSSALFGCPPSTSNSQKTDGATSAACTKFGQTCEVSRGKLGTCVQKDECTGTSCFVCQSQH
ncbi:hypothetical protein AKJ09_06774 [Labilithrix luteola]|uniref:Lipoprotein n=1 Tax=Labilithrix luteola TaxID=1391654 RepID=A0A0K1Q2S1_9BACT|nr:hypothetical protein [Labilithrix luteola]AKV00111.1 hypothetical protein AKJ09_06774 [Labilithrix luteola]